jgi:hypothetical protein
VEPALTAVHGAAAADDSGSLAEREREPERPYLLAFRAIFLCAPHADPHHLLSTVLLSEVGRPAAACGVE